MLDRERIFSREIRDYTYELEGMLIYGGEVAGFRFVEMKFGVEPTYYDIGTKLINSLGFLGVPDTYYGLEYGNPLELKEVDGKLLTDFEVRHNVEAVELTDKFVVGYILRHYLFKNYTVYEGDKLINGSNRVLIVNKSMYFMHEKDKKCVTEVTFYYKLPELQALSELARGYSLYPQYVDQEIIARSGSLNIMLESDRLSDLIADLGGVYTTQSPGYAFLYFLKDYNSHNTKNFICYSPESFEVLWSGVDNMEVPKIWNVCLEDLKTQLQPHKFVLI